MFRPCCVFFLSERQIYITRDEFQTTWLRVACSLRTTAVDDRTVGTVGDDGSILSAG